MAIPYLNEHNGTQQLLVHDTPFLMLAGEVHNSNSSSKEYMETVWEKAQMLGMNCLLLPVSWEMIEPEEGKFDFTIVDALLQQARTRKMKIGILWFGSWKNAECMYVPAWVKKDIVRFKRAQIVKGENKSVLAFRQNRTYSTLSYFCEETRNADAYAFAKLMAYLRKIDETENTVITVQVENETGLLGADREYSDEADWRFADRVPQDFVSYMKEHTMDMVDDVRKAVEEGAKSGSWKEVFGGVAEEVFSAYHIAQYVNIVAEAGKREYPLPMTVNCWLNKKGEVPGQYPSGGPVSRMHEVWDYCAPNIDVYCPDIYVPYFGEVCDEFTRRKRPLYIPECATHSYVGPRLVYAVGHYHAICYAPFGFEEMGEPFNTMQGYLFGMDVEDLALKTPQNKEEYTWYNRTLGEMMPMLTEKYGTDSLQAVIGERQKEDSMEFKKFGITAKFALAFGEKRDGVCLGLELSEDECFVLANRCELRFFSTDTERPNLDFLSIEEGKFEHGTWCPGRRLNGDEAVFMKYDVPTLLKVKVFIYQ